MYTFMYFIDFVFKLYPIQNLTKVTRSPPLIELKFAPLWLNLPQRFNDCI